MTDETNPPAGVPLRKAGAARPDPTAAKPRTVALATAALIAAAVFAVLGALGVAGQRSWLHTESAKANAKAVSSAVSSATASAAKKSQDVASASASASSSAVNKYPLGGKKLDHQISTQVQGTLIGSVLVLLVNGFLAYGAWRGRHWTRWGVTGFFILATFTGTGVGLTTVLTGLASGVPVVVRIPELLAGLSMIAAVVLVNLRPSTEFFAANRPVAPAGMPQRRGLFGRPAPARGPQPQRAAGRATTRPANPAAPATPARDADRGRTKKRAAAESAARGAELARSRAKASKSRRTER